LRRFPHLAAARPFTFRPTLFLNPLGIFPISGPVR